MIINQWGKMVGQYPYPLIFFIWYNDCIDTSYIPNMWSLYDYNIIYDSYIL